MVKPTSRAQKYHENPTHVALAMGTAHEDLSALNGHEFHEMLSKHLQMTGLCLQLANKYTL